MTFGEMATHSSILARKNLRTEKPVGLQSMGSQRVGHNRVAEHIQQHLGDNWGNLSMKIYWVIYFM